MLRRTFLARCGCAALGAVLLPASVFPLSTLRAADLAAGDSAQLRGGDRALLRLLSSYGSDAYFWGSQVFTRATGVGPQNGVTHLLVRVADDQRLVAFLRSDAEKTLGKVRVLGDTLSFTFKGMPYTVTNADAQEFARAIAGGGVSRRHVSDGDVALFAHETLLYHPATGALSDPAFSLTKHHLDLAEAPTGGLKARFQTLVQGWLASQSSGLKLGKKFTAFQDDLLASEPTDKAAKKVVQALLANLTALAAAFDVESLRPLLTSPLVSTSLQRVLGLDADEVIADVTKLRAELSSGDYSDAALWLATLLGTQIQDGTADDLLDLLSGDHAVDLVNRATLAAAKRLLASQVPTAH